MKGAVMIVINATVALESVQGGTVTVRLGGKRFYILASFSLLNLFSHWGRRRGESQNGMVDQDKYSESPLVSDFANAGY
uniref:Uncharacterized protein n=1 Tax=Cucumis melo TaxID=3656 RepID=A0A9I9EDU3_CUCME